MYIPWNPTFVWFADMLWEGHATWNLVRKRKIFMTAVIKVFISTLEIWFPFMELALLFLLHLGISECHSEAHLRMYKWIIQQVDLHYGSLSTLFASSTLPLLPPFSLLFSPPVFYCVLSNSHYYYLDLVIMTIWIHHCPMGVTVECLSPPQYQHSI